MKAKKTAGTLAKVELLSMAQAGDARPRQNRHPMGKMLSYLTCATHSYYDAEFDRTIREMRPDWFDEKLWHRREPA